MSNDIKNVTSLDKRPKFSFIMPVYNVEKYLDETVQSILDQTMSFERNCEIIFINDGSTDNSEEICLKYKKKFPRNIKYLKQTNKGVSAARNGGLREATGKYISFLDSDDKLSIDALNEAYHFMEEHQEEIDICAIKMVFFDAKQGDHILNWKFSRTGVVDLSIDPEYVQLSSSSTFIKNEIIKQRKIQFDTRVKYSEDSKFVSEILLEKLKIGILANPTYYYRRRQENNSAINSSLVDKSWYFITPKLVYKHLFNYSRDKYGHVPRYIQHLVMYDLQWRFTQERQSTLIATEAKEYKQALLELINDIETEVILYQKNIYIEHKLYILKAKFNIADPSKLEKRGNSYLIDDHEVYNYEKFKQNFVLAITNVGEHNVILEGIVRGYLFPDVKFGFLVEGNFLEAERINYGQKASLFLGEKLHEPNNFRVNIRIKNGVSITPVLMFEDGSTKPLKIIPGRHSKLPPYTGNSYFATSHFIIVHLSPATLKFTKHSSLTRVKKELRFTKALLGSKEIGKKLGVKVLSLRLYFFIVNPFVRKNIWLISDRPNIANDNGEAFFKYVTHQQNNYFKAFFIISRNSKDYIRLKKFGKVLDPNGIKYKLLFLLSHKVISSAADDFVTNPYKTGVSPWLQDIFDYEFVFLQHGVIHNDLSSWLNKFRKNIGTFVVTSPKEYDAITEGRYGYYGRELILSGQPRYDYLKNATEKSKIILMPTWRQGLAGELNSQTRLRDKHTSFKETNYYNQWQKFIKDKRFNEILKDHNISVDFYLHPALHANIGDFEGTGNVHIKKPPFDYTAAFNEGSLLVTDYSSVAFDFAYLRKPVVYFQFDKKEFYANHLFDEGYFGYERDGFGPVVHSVDALVSAVKLHANSQFELMPKYKERTDGFYKWGDNLNSLRVYTHLIQKDINSYINSAIIQNKKVRHNKRYPKRILNVFWWRYYHPLMLNFGDEITPYIIQSLWGYNLKWSEIKDAELIGAGSILEMAERRQQGNSIHVWGSGYMKKEDTSSHNSNFIYHAVRGKLTLGRTTADKNIVLGDPGLLASRVFKRARFKKYKIGIVPHYTDRANGSLDKYRDLENILFIDPLQPPDKVAKDITSCEIIFSSSLHGLIFADSFEVPNYWMPLSGNVTGGSYKFEDYYSSTKRELKKVTPEVLDDENRIDILKKEYEEIPHLKKMQKDLIKSFPYN